MDSFAPGYRFDRFEILSLLGEGGMGTVWKARHAGLQRIVVIKVLKADLSKHRQARLRFQREGEAAARIRHPHIVEVFDVGEHQGAPYLVMEFLNGEDFGQLLSRRRRLEAAEIADVMVPVCAAVAAAHEVGVIHRDLKPENIFLQIDRERGVRPKVLDFGISHVDGDANELQTATSALLGTPRYMSPEQARGAGYVDERSDQYALGAILYRAATGEVPVSDAALYEMLRRIVHGEYEAPRAVNPTLSEGFEGVILRAMALLPQARFPSVRALGTALLPFASPRVQELYRDTFAMQGGTLPDSISAALTPQPIAADQSAATTLVRVARDVTPRVPGRVVPRQVYAMGGIAAILVLGALAATYRAKGSSNGTISRRVAESHEMVRTADPADVHTQPQSPPTPTLTPTPTVVEIPVAGAYPDAGTVSSASVLPRAREATRATRARSRRTAEPSGTMAPVVISTAPSALATQNGVIVQ